MIRLVSKLHVRKMASTCRIAVLQLTVTNDKKRNRDKCDQLLKKAASYGAQVAFLPECFDFIGESAKETSELAETIDKPDGLVDFYKQLAKDLNMSLSLGGFHHKNYKYDEEEMKSNNNKIGNMHIFINNQGQIEATYNKTHLFDVEIPERGIRLKESDYVLPGQSIVEPVSILPGSLFKLGLSVCYDMRFPELSIALKRKGANILSFPSAFTVPTGSAGHWYALLKARAIENQCYVIAAAQTGKHNAKRSSYGHSCIIDPWGTIIAECPEGENLIVAEISMEKINTVQTEMPVDKHKRSDLYALATTGEVHIPEESFDETTIHFGQHENSGKCVVLQSRLSYVLVNKKPVLPGHLLVIPQRIAHRFTDLNPDEVQDLFMTVQVVQRMIESFTSSNSSTICIQDGKEAGQTVQHVHVHVLPRKSGDFAENDDIYDKLQNHDREGITDDIKWRSNAEMFEECSDLRDYFRSLK